MRLCVPGHGGGAYAPAALERALERFDAWQLDWTEVAGLDDLAFPSGPIQAAERRLAAAFGAHDAAILVGGSTAGILAAVLACARGARVAMAPTQHRSVYAALALAGAEPVFLPERTDPATGLALGVDWGAGAAETLRATRPALAIVAHPTYQGVAGPLAPLTEAAHALGTLVLADSAHGAHFGLDPRLPPPALDQGADIAVLGLHKSLGALTQTAALAWRDTVDGAPVRAALRLIQSSSPSYLLMASADAAREAMVRSGRARWRAALDRAERVRGLLSDELWQPDVRQDPSRVVWLAPAGTGQDIVRALRASDVEAEYADERFALLLVGPNLSSGDVPRLERAVRRARSAFGALTDRAAPPAAILPPMLPDGAGMLAALTGAWDAVALVDSVGRVAADFLVPYPPGVPAALPGARLDAAVVDRLARALAWGQEVQGVHEGSTIRVVRTEGGASA